MESPMRRPTPEDRERAFQEIRSRLTLQEDPRYAGELEVLAFYASWGPNGPPTRWMTVEVPPTKVQGEAVLLPLRVLDYREPGHGSSSLRLGWLWGDTVDFLKEVYQVEPGSYILVEADLPYPWRPQETKGPRMMRRSRFPVIEGCMP